MGSFTAGEVVLVRFPFLDLSQSKLRPAVVLADCGYNDWLLCQITSRPYSDSRAVELADADFQAGSLRTTSYARPTKLFTAHEILIAATVGVLHDAALGRITDAVMQLIKPKGEQSGRAEPPPRVSVSTLREEFGHFQCLRERAVGGGRSPGSFGGIARMGYSIIVLVVSIALVAYFIFATEASLIFKAAVSGLFVFSFACFYWIRGWSLVGSFLLVALSIFIVFYRVCQQARSPGK